MITEQQVQTEIKRALEFLGCHVTDTSQPRASMVTPGIPDLLVMNPDWGVSLWVEVKRPEGSTTDHQEQWHDIAEASGQRVIVARSVDEVVEALEDAGAPIRP